LANGSPVGHRLGDLALVDELARARLDPLEGLADLADLHVLELDVERVQGGQFGDPVTHVTCAGHGDLLDLRHAPGGLRRGSAWRR